MANAGPTTEILVVYGTPPGMRLFNAAGRPVGSTFELSRMNQHSFEVALRRALASFLHHHVSVMEARLIFIRDAASLAAAVTTYRPRKLIYYYGHAIPETNVLLPSLGKSIATWQLIDLLKKSSVTDFDILGCNSVSIAAEVSLGASGTRVGYLRNARTDNVVADPVTLRVKTLTIDAQELHHFGPKAR